MMEFDGGIFLLCLELHGSLFIISFAYHVGVGCRGVLELTMFFSCSLRGSSRYVVHSNLEKEIDFPHFCSTLISSPPGGGGGEVLGCI